MDVDKETYFSHLRLYNSEQLPLRDFLQYQTSHGDTNLTLNRKLGLGLRVYIAISNPWVGHLCSKNKLLGSRYITEITGTATLDCTKYKKKFHMG